ILDKSAPGSLFRVSLQMSERHAPPRETA
ncbi:MAG: hypothetical protein JWM30_2688, partial [Burkholderia sp.]|nr:hypothetical protein [Burkholderia sp.]